MHRISLANLLAQFSLVCFVVVTPVFACTCPGVGGPTESVVKGFLEGSTAVFRGKVIGYEYRRGLLAEQIAPSMTPEEAAEKEVRIVRFKIDRWWKLPLSEEVLLITDSWRDPIRSGEILPRSESFSGCQLFLIKGESYVIYASGPRDALRYGSCSRALPLSRSATDLKVLGKGKSPVNRR